MINENCFIFEHLLNPFVCLYDQISSALEQLQVLFNIYLAVALVGMKLYSGYLN